MMSDNWEKIASSRPVNRQAALSTSRSEQDPRPELRDCPDLIAVEEMETKRHPDNFVNLTGLRVGRLTVLGLKKKSATDKTGRGGWVCRCDCGRYLSAKASVLKRGKIDRCRSCDLNHFGRHGSYPPRIRVDVKPPLASPNIINQQISGGNFVDMSGVRVGKLSVLGLSALAVKGQRRKWVCRCDCGELQMCKTHTLKKGKMDRCENCRDSFIATHGCLPKLVKVDVPSVIDRTKLLSIETTSSETTRPDPVIGLISDKEKTELNGQTIKEDYLAGRRIAAMEILGCIDTNGPKDKLLAIKCECNDVFSMLRSKVLEGEACACKKCILARPEFTVERWKTELVSGLYRVRAAAQSDQSPISNHDYALLDKAIKKLQGARRRGKGGDQVAQNGMSDDLRAWVSSSEKGTDE